MATNSLTASMKATVVIAVSIMVYLLVFILGGLILATFDIYALAGAPFLIAYGVLAVFAWKRRPWAFLGVVALSVFGIVATPLTITQQTGNLDLWASSLSTVLFALASLEGGKSYLELRRPQPNP